MIRVQWKCQKYEVHTISFQTFFIWAFKIVINSWKFSILLLYILWDDWPIFMTSDSNEQLQQELEYTLLKPDCHSWWISKMQSDTLKERYAIKFCFKLGKNATKTHVLTEQQVHCNQRRLLRMGLEVHVCTINKSAHTKNVWKLISCTSYIMRLYIWFWWYKRNFKICQIIGSFSWIWLNHVCVPFHVNCVVPLCKLTKCYLAFYRLFST